MPADKRTKTELRRENDTLRHIARTLQIYAKRYANGSNTYAPSEVNDCTTMLLEMGVSLNPGGEGIVWALDGMGRKFDQLPEVAATPHTKEATGEVVPVSSNRRLMDAMDARWGPDVNKFLRHYHGLLGLVLQHVPDTTPAYREVRNLAAAILDEHKIKQPSQPKNRKAKGTTRGK